MPPFWLLFCLFATTTSAFPRTSETVFTIRNWHDLDYLFVLDPPSPEEDSAVHCSRRSRILAYESIEQMLFRLDWNDAGFAKITCVANNKSLTATPAPLTDRYTRATVVASSVVWEASYWALGGITWDPDVTETSFIINHLFTDFLISQEVVDGGWSPDHVMTTRFPKHYGMKRARWVVQVADDETIRKWRPQKKGSSNVSDKEWVRPKGRVLRAVGSGQAA